MLFTTDRLRGNGIYDKTRQRTRRELGWKPKIDINSGITKTINYFNST